MSIKNKSDSLIEHLIYSFATGRWQAGDKLPSVRQAELKWSVNRLTVLSAYRHLEASGLIESRSRSGYYVLGGSSLYDLSQYQRELDGLYEQFTRIIEQGSSLLPSVVFKSLAKISGYRVSQAPEIAFMECSHFQAATHAQECEAELKMPVHPAVFTVGSDVMPAMPTSVKYVLTTGFHFQELKQLTKTQLINVQIELDVKQILTAIPEGVDVCVFERTTPMGESIYADIKQQIPLDNAQLKISQNLNTDLAAYLKQHSKGVALLAPRLLDLIDAKFKNNQRVVPINYRIILSEWPKLKQTLNLAINSYQSMTDKPSSIKAGR